MNVADALCAPAYCCTPVQAAWAKELALAKPKKPMLRCLSAAPAGEETAPLPPPASPLPVAGLLHAATLSARAAAAAAATASRTARVMVLLRTEMGCHRGRTNS